MTELIKLENSFLTEFRQPPSSEGLTSARTDKEIMEEWIAQAHSDGNRKQRIKELRRLSIWLVSEKIYLSELTTTDCLRFYRFLQEPPRELCGPSVRFLTKDGTPNISWRPFSSGLKGPTLKQAAIILQTFFEFLSEIQWTRLNVWKIAVKPKKSAKLHPGIDRVLSPETMHYLERTILLMSENSHIEKLIKFRSHLLIGILSLTGIRRQELSNIRMCDFSKDKNNRWWLTVTGKGDKEGRIPVPKGFLSRLYNYRMELGLPMMPNSNEKGPLLYTIRRPFRPMSYSAIYMELKRILKNAAVDCENSHISDELNKAATHWFRHTYATQLIRNGVPLLHVQKNLRHSSLSTTEGYLHVTEDERGQSIEDLKY